MGGPPIVIFRGKNDFRINRNSVGDEYGAGNPEVRVDSERGVFRYGRKRDFSPCVYRGLGERSTRVREYASTQREKSWWTLFGLTTKAGNGIVKYFKIVSVWFRSHANVAQACSIVLSAPPGHTANKFSQE
jgi:hypothetical protein